MDNTTKDIDNKLLSDLQSTDQEVVLAAIETIREKGNSTYIEPLFNILASTQIDDTKRAIKKLLSEIKPAESVDVLIGMIVNPEYQPILSDVISICWESGLDFSNSLNLFIQLAIEGDYMVAFEAFTVIESQEPFLDIERAEGLLKPVFDVMDSATSERKVLLEATITHVRSLTEE